MAEMLIYWDEIEDGAFPDCCMTCGCEDTELVPRRLTTGRWIPGVAGMLLRRAKSVPLPFCRLHASRPWVAWGRLDARRFTDEGVWMKNLSPIFVEEMEAFREEEEEYEDRRRRKKRRKRPRDDRDEQEDNDEREPFSDTRPVAQPSGRSGGAVVLTVVFSVLLLSALLGVACCVGNVFLGGGKFNHPGIRK
jgi:hypothetical protein